MQALSAEAATRRTDRAGHYDDAVEQVVAEYLDRSYYTSTYADIREHGIDPVEHFCRQGWQERRNPAAWFDTAYYLDTNADVAQSGINPFWHYLVEGRAEDRRPHRPGGFRRDIIDRAVDPDTRTRDWARPEPTGVLARTRLERILRAAIETAKGVVLSFSHDCYVRVTGGIQLFIADEQARYARQGMAYIHLSPFAPLLRLADAASGPCLLNLVIDGREVGVTSAADLEAALLRSPRRPEERRLFLVHCLLGHSVPDLIALRAALASEANVFWVHDYSSICLGYTLLRNDVAYCHAPPPDSITCRVCVYGTQRPAHLADVRTLFEAVPFQVVAPSQAALAIWREHSDLPHVSSMAHEHCGLVPSDEEAAPRDVDAAGARRLHRLRPGTQGLAALGGAGVARPAPRRLRVRPSRQPRDRAVQRGAAALRGADLGRSAGRDGRRGARPGHRLGARAVDLAGDVLLRHLRSDGRGRRRGLHAG